MAEKMEGGVWGIIIIISAFMIQFFAFGVSGCIGVYNIEFLEYFHASTAEVSLIASLNYGVFLGSGPIISFLMTKFSYRKIALGGSVLVVLGVFSVYFLPYLPVMYLTLGVITGFGCTCVYIPSHTLSGLYYDKNRSLATGVATSGSGLGGGVMPVLAGVFINTYAWRGSFIILAGLCLHLFIFAGLLRNPPRFSEILADSMLLHSIDEKNDCESWNINKSDKSCEKSDQSCVRKALDLSSTQENHDFDNVDMNHLDYMDKLSWRPGAGYLSIENLVHTANDNKSLTYHQEAPESKSEKNTEGNHLLDEKTSNDGEGEQVNSAPLIDNSFQTENSLLSINNDVESHNKAQKISLTPETSRHIYIFKSYNFDIYFLNNIFWNMSTAILLAFIPEFLRLQDKTAMEAAWLTGCLGIGCFLGGIAGGVLGNLKKINRIVLFLLANFFLGGFTVILPFNNSIMFCVVILLCIGFCFGIILGLLIVVLIDLIGIESLGNGMGYLMLANGLGTLTGPIFAGVLIDYSGRFELSIYFSAILSFVSALVMALIPLRHYLVCRKRADEEY